MITLWGAEHARRYEENDGVTGGGWEDPLAPPTLLLTTTGRRSGRKHKCVLVYAPSATGYVVVASRNGQVNNPDWYHNVVADPEITIQVMADRSPGRARVVTEEPEHGELWQAMLKVYPGYDELQARTARQIPVVVLEPATKLGESR
nr:nitroreductase family deazaflavin-dependent oxidoreductase [Streptomyces sp. NBC_00830]WTB35721.1 nitroreductase family deazaflavin-dependent oxidoreductase [Streptomyces sp. NBC_00830]